MDKAITTALLIVISMVMSVALFNAAYPASIQAGDALARMADRSDDRLDSQIQIIHAAGELNTSGVWDDTNNDGDFNAFVWVKNVGSNAIAGLENMDVFFGPEGNFQRIPYRASGGSKPYWNYTIENGDTWSPTSTIEVTIHLNFTPDPGRFYFKAVAPNGVSDTLVFGM
jgi:archaellum component FlaG (FlaF/FlaG flagellin family)